MQKLSSKKVKPLSPSIIQKELHISGGITGEGALDVFGRIDGDIRCLSLILREGGAVVGDIVAEKVEIYGEVKGNVKARAIICGSTARITGDILHQSVQIENGAYVDGNCRKHISEEDQAAEEQAQAEALEQAEAEVEVTEHEATEEVEETQETGEIIELNKDREAA